MLWMYPLFLEKFRFVLWIKELRFVKKNQTCFYVDKKKKDL